MIYSQKHRQSAVVNAGAMSYSVNGKQYVAIAAGNSVFAYGLP